jgi:OmpA-OmpF porin, OOP family
MMIRALVFASAVMLPVIVQAQSLPGPYISISAGPGFAGNMLSAAKNTEIDTGVGPAGLVDFGWAFGNGLRAEIEGSYRSNDVSNILTRRVSGLLVPLSGVDGSAKTYAVMANMAYDIPFRPFSLPIQPYVGAGLGLNKLDFGNGGGGGNAIFNVGNGNTVTSPVNISFGSADAFAYQGMAGFSMPVSAVPGLEATLEYRYFGTAQANVPVNRVSSTGVIVNGQLLSEQTHNGFQMSDQSILFGLRYSFGGR